MATAIALLVLGAVPIVWMTDADLRSPAASSVSDDMPDAVSPHEDPLEVRLVAETHP